MKKSIFSIVLFILILTSKVYARENTMIDVRIGTSNGVETLKARDNIVIKDRNNYVIERLRTNEVEVRISGLDLIIKGDETLEFDSEQVMISSESDEIIYKNSTYRGSIRFGIDGSKINIINNLDMDDYLKGVLPKEMGASFPREALKAQAVASRSFAMTNINKHKSEGFNLCNTTHCQVYGGKSAENNLINEIVEETRGEYVYYNGSVAETVFHSNNGGYMESAKNAWGSEIPYLISKKDNYSTNTVNSNWKLEYSLNDMGNKLKAAGVNVGNLKDIRVVSTNNSGRVDKLEVSGSNKTEVINAVKFRSALGNNNFKSTYFTINGESVSTGSSYDLYVEDGYSNEKIKSSSIYVQGYSSVEKINLDDIYLEGQAKNNNSSKPSSNTSGKIVIDGKGFGHGVGMSQYGAKKMAEEGFNYKEILRHYYDGTEIY